MRDPSLDEPRWAPGTPDGRAVIVAMDHGIGGGAVPGLERPMSTLRTVLDGKPDGVLLSPGLAQHGAAALSEYRVALWVTLDHYGTSTIPGGDDGLELHTVIASPARARDLGAAGVKTLLVFGYGDPAAYLANLRAAGTLIEDAHRLGLPVMVEAVLWGSRVPADRRDDWVLVANACRIASELGADVIKTTMPREHLKDIAEALPVPVLILGGPHRHDRGPFLDRVTRAIAEGARGIVAGRMVWQSADPADMVRGLRAAVHGGRPAEAPRS